MKIPISLRKATAFISLIGIALISVLIAVNSRDIVPEKYFYDSASIDSLKHSAEVLEIGNSYNNTALFYQLLGINEDSTLNSLLFPAIFITAIFYILRRLETKNLLGTTAICFYACITAAIYLSQYSKESIVLLLCLGFLASCHSLRLLTIWVAAAAVYAIYFRAYWLITLSLFAVNLLILKKYNKPTLFLATAFLLYLLLALLLPIIYGQELGQHRINSNGDRIGSIDALTLITPTIPGSGWLLDTINTFLQLLLLLFPVPLAFTGNILHLTSFIALSLISCIALIKLKQQHKSGALRNSPKLRSGYSLLFSALSVQAIFEPDYGSYIKHLTPLLTILMFTYNQK
ncbi:hypothetical protein KW851_07965 [Pseudomonas sp. PDM33]|uniref:hypothetical protein n=1 Tax=Pseudomonas sp. PDM33 TaxID=2854765 RepID=UPI001C465D66|nr:hypothetical protein [Pseudomonas sp. PDM33]MBV7582751.1 hypothetical protein [Pseudomonas sp. PDM33]